jgi:LemA protein
MTPLLIAGILVIIIIPVFIYNNLVRKKNAVDNAFHSMDVMLKKRFDLIPMLVDTVKGYVAHENEILYRLTALRQRVTGGPGTINEKVGIDNELTDVIQHISVTLENYPSLRAGENFLRLQGAVNETEEQLAASRRFYNAAVKDYHNAIGTFPSSLIAGWAGMKPLIYFSTPDADKAVPSTGFST